MDELEEKERLELSARLIARHQSNGSLAAYPTNHLFILSPRNPLRKFCVFISTSKYFDWFIMLAIAFNCVLMALNNQLPSDDKSRLNKQLEVFEYYLLGIFIVEAVLKIISQGFLLHRKAYLRNGWNILDFIVVITGIIGLPVIGIGQSASFMKVIKAARVLRPLKLVSGVPSLQVVMTSMLKSMASLLQISLLIGFVIIMYGIIGLSLFMGKFHKACFYENTTTIAGESARLCGSRPCPDKQECKEYWLGPNDGITSFDNILIACLTVFTCITCEGWTETMYFTFDVFDRRRYFIWIYYYTMNIIGAQFMLNLVLGVLSGEFSREKDRVENHMMFIKQRKEEIAAQRSADSYGKWVDKGELADMKEVNGKCRCC